jgi:Fe-S cluster assembly protein SufD
MTPAEQGLVASFRPDRGEAGWVSALRSGALARFSELRLPTARHEDWRFTSLAALAPLPLGRAPEGDLDRARALLARAPAAEEGARLVFLNGRFRSELSSGGSLPQGIVLASLGEALRRRPAEVRPHLGRLARPDALAFVAANAALFDDGAFLSLPAGAALDAPVALVFLTDGPAAAVAHPRTLIVAGEGARATVQECFLGPEGAGYLTNAVTEIVLAAGAEVEHVRLQLEGAEAFHVSSLHAEQGAGARLAAHAFSLGARLSRSETWTRLGGEGAHVAANGLYMADGQRLVDNFSWIEHAVPRCTTEETYKGILDGKARGVFSGRIRVMPGAQKTVARQMNSNLLLSDDAIVDTKPQLEIFADDVKCGHGGTVGQLDETALFYLRSRGVPEAEARSLLVWAFASEMVGLVGAPSIRARAKNLVAARLPAGARLLEVA